MGSFAVQQYVIEHSGEIDALVLSGSGALERLAAAHLSDLGNLRNIREDLPVCVFSETGDPAGKQLEGVRILITRYESAGLYDISHKFYPSQTSREEVYEGLLSWISAVLERQKHGWFKPPSIA